MLMYGSVSTDGTFVEQSSVKIPTGFEGSRLLSLPPTNDFVTSMYPIGSGPGSDVGGYLVFGNFQVYRLPCTPM